MKAHLHLSIGPVQAFVAQSRRTRDLWSSSYLLSFLAAHALRGARGARGAIIRPLVENDPMLRWVEQRGTREPPRFGSLPNLFTIELPEGTEPESIADNARRAFDGAWNRVCEVVWRRFVARAAEKGRSTRTIWERQINGFWEFMWVAGDAGDNGLLARRKLWRTHWLPEEPGDKCTLMPDFQELSGYVRATERTLQESFWSEIRFSVGQTELEEKKERLCAIALVKRLYARREIVEDALGWFVDAEHWPSTVDAAGVPWAQAVFAAAPLQASGFADAVVREAVGDVLSGGVRELVDAADANQPFLRLDANWFHRSFVTNAKLAPLKEEMRRCRLLELLAELGKGLNGPSIYFAMLLSDGDSLGRLVRSLGMQIVSPALARFTEEAPRLVRRYHGATIYAGGDDLLAMLPVDEALECARDLEQTYRRSFETAGAGPKVDEATLSAAVVFAHARTPLSLVLGEAHRMLDEVAKDGNGRNSLGVSVYRAHECAAQWVSTWIRSAGERKEYEAVSCLCEARNALRNRDFSEAFLHRVGRTLAALSSGPAKAGDFVELPDGFELIDFLRGELEPSAERQQHQASQGEVEQILDRLLRRSARNEVASSYVGLDGLAVARFLAGGGREEEHGRGLEQ